MGGKRSGKKSTVASFFYRKLRSARRTQLQPVLSLSPLFLAETPTAPAGAKEAKKKAGSRLWMLFNRWGKSEVTELDKSAILRRASIPVRDLRILGPIFSHSSRIITREKAMVVNLEFIKAIITADEVMLLDPLCSEVLAFVDQLRQQICLNSQDKVHESDHVDVLGKQTSSTGEQWLHNENDVGEHVLPFEFQVLEVALEFVCTYLASNVFDLARNAYYALDELTKNVNTKNLEHVRSLKSNLTCLLARVQKVKDEIEHLLDDNEDMSQLYLTRKRIENQQFESLLASATSNSIVLAPNLARINSHVLGNSSFISFHSDDNNVEDLEMLLEAYFMQLEGTRNKILSVREYIDDSEDYVNIKLDNQRNELLQLQLFLGIFSFALAVESMMVGLFSTNLLCSFCKTDYIFAPFVGGTSALSFLIFFLLLEYARRKKLFGS